MASFNRVICMGNCTRDPELRYTPSGTSVCELGIAMNESRKGQNGERIDEPVFCDITLWGRTAEIAAEFLQKGAPVLIEGRLKLDQWQDKEGNKRSKLKVVGERLQLLGGRGQGGSQGNPGGQSQGGGGYDGGHDDGGGYADDNVPF